MALDFPSPASPGQIYSYGIYTWEYNGTYWKSISTNSFLPISGGTVTGSTSFTAGLLSSSISATTYENLPSFNFAQINGITQFSAGTNNYINFSGVNITITSTPTNTLVLSAGTGGGSGTISGTVNYIPKFTSSSSIGNSSITNISNTVYITGLTSNTDTALVVNKVGKGYVSEFSCIGSNTNLSAVAGFTDIGPSQFGIYGVAKGYANQCAVLGENTGSGSTIIAIRGIAANSVNSVGTVIGGVFQAQIDTNVSSYSVQLSDGTEGLNKVLISKTSDGKANWSDTLTGLTAIEVSSATIKGNITITGNTTISGLTANQLVATDSTDTLVSLSTTTYPSLTELTYVKGVTSDIQTQLNNRLATSGGTINGNLTITGNTTISGLTASQIVATDANDTLVSLDTATYPSLTELSYVKGVTSSIQTQITNKKDTFVLRFSSNQVSPADNATYYFNDSTVPLSTSATIYKLIFPFACTLVGASITAQNNQGTATAEASTVSFRLNNSADTQLSNSVVFNGAPLVVNVYSVTGLNTSIAAGDTGNIKWVTPTWVTNPTQAIIVVNLYLQRT